MVKVTLPESQNLSRIFNFRGHFLTFGAENTQKNRQFSCPKTMPKQFGNKSKNSLKTSPKIVKNDHIERQVFTKKLDFRGRLSNFGAENTDSMRHFKFEINAQTLHKLL